MHSEFTRRTARVVRDNTIPRNGWTLRYLPRQDGNANGRIG